MRYSITILLIFISIITYCQELKKEKFSDAIEDNSYLVEEAYNQEERVVQHISNGQYFPDAHSFFYTFTQEIPIFGLKHQLSYSLPYSFINSNQSTGLGDIMLNYRYQLTYKESWACVAPRLSLIVPSGNKDKGLGNGAWGLQVNLPVSKRLSNHLVVHYNLGATYLSEVEMEYDINQKSIKKSITNYYMGASLIWLTTENINFMLESVEYLNSNLKNDGGIKYEYQTVINPGLRYAINIKNLQIVPGISFPVYFQKSAKPETSMFFYLSFEHPY
jgi:hypothetical protein